MALFFLGYLIIGELLLLWCIRPGSDLVEDAADGVYKRWAFLIVSLIMVVAWPYVILTFVRTKGS